MARRVKRARAFWENTQTKTRVFLLILGIGVVGLIAWGLLRVPPDLLLLLGVLLAAVLSGMLVVWIAIQQAPTAPLRSRKDLQAQTAAHTVNRPIQIEDLLRLSPEEFEHFVGDLLMATGQYSQMIRTGGARDRGVDLIGRNHLGLGVVVQCKRYRRTHNVAPREVRELGHAFRVYRTHNIREAILATTSSYTQQCHEEKREYGTSMILWDGEVLVQFTRQFWQTLPEKWQRLLLQTSET